MSARRQKNLSGEPPVVDVVSRCVRHRRALQSRIPRHCRRATVARQARVVERDRAGLTAGGASLTAHSGVSDITYIHISAAVLARITAWGELEVVMASTRELG